MTEIEFIKRKGGEVLLYNDYQFYKHTSNKDGSVKWRCSNWKKLKCPGTVTIVEKRVVTKANEHKCKADPIRNEKDRNIAILRNRAKNSDLPMPTLYENTLREMSIKGLNDTVESFPEFSNIKHVLYTDRNKEAGVSKLQSKIGTEIEIPQQFTDFILADYSYEGDRIIIFCTPESRNLIGAVKECFIDATFQSCPVPFFQLYIIHGDLGSSVEYTNVKPLIYALMPDKKEHTYDIVLQLIKSQLPQWEPSIVHCDYEIGAINAILKMFPSVHVMGCYYHWVRCMWKNAKLMNFGKSKPERRVISLCAVLPLLPKEMLESGWEYINSDSTVHIFKMQKFMNYIKKFWLRPKYVDMISVFGARHRTNNVAEGFHSKMNKAINKNTINIMRLLNIIKKIDRTNQIKIIKKSNAKRTKQIILTDDAVQHIIIQLITGEISVGHTLEKLR